MLGMQLTLVMSHQVVQHQVETEAGREAKRRGVSQKGRMKIIVRQLADVSLHHHLGFAIGRDGIESGAFVDELLAGSAVITAR